METDNNLEMDKFIPSGTYRVYLKENNIELDSRQKVKLIYVSGKPMEEKWKAYRKLIVCGETDTNLRSQLNTLVSYEEKFVREELAEKNGAVYKLEIFDPDENDGWNEAGYFVSLRDAEHIGMKTGHRFCITRYMLEKLSEAELDCCEKMIEEHGYLNMNEQVFHYDADARVRSLDRMVKIGEEESAEYSKYADADDQLSNIFADFPVCFENGDIVRSVGRHGPDGLYGIVHIFPNREEEIRRIAAIPGMVPDDELLTEFLYEDGEFEHHHILATELEKVELNSIPENQRMVLSCASELINGKGTFQGLQYLICEMKRERRGNT